MLTTFNNLVTWKRCKGENHDDSANIRTTSVYTPNNLGIDEV